MHLNKITSLLAACLIALAGFSQAPQRMTYQAVVRNSNDALVQSSPIGMKVSILQGSVTGSAVYVETHATLTNQNGLLNIEIGGGTVVTGTYENGIFWAGGPYFLKTEIDPLGGANYTITATSELLSVPYSNYASVSGNMVNNAMDFVGAYAPDNSGGGVPIAAYIIVNYLGADKVSVWINFFIDPEDVQLTLFGTVSGNTITFPTGNMVGLYGSGTKVGDNLNFSLFLNSGPFGTFSAIKQ
jgi:hypothetical protein